jgi:hypothetical protein
MLVYLRHISKRGLVTLGLLALFSGFSGLISPIVLAEPPIGESMSPWEDNLPLRLAGAARLSEIRSVTCQSYIPDSFADSFCGFEPTGAYGGEFPVLRLPTGSDASAEVILLDIQPSGFIDNPRDFSYIQRDGNWASKEHASWRLPQLEFKL